MPNLPTYESKRNISTSIGGPVLRDEATQAYDAPLKAIDTAFDLNQKWMQAQDTIQYTSYKANVGEAEIALLQTATNDTNINNSDARIAEFKRVQDASLKGTNSKALQQKMALEGQLELKMFASKVDGIYKIKQIHVANADAMRLIEIQKSNYINSPDEEGKLEASNQIAKVVSDQVKVGLWWKDDGDEKYNTAIKEAQDALKDRDSLRRVKEKELDLANKAAVNDNEKNYIKMKLTGVDKLGTPISRDELIGMVRQDLNNKIVSPEFADRYITALTSPKSLNAKTIDKDFAEIISEINAGHKKPEMIRSKLLKASSDGYISEADFSAAITYLDMLENKNPDDLVAMNTRKSWVGIEVFSEDSTKKEESRSRMSRSFINKLQSGVDPQAASIEAMREEVLYLHPEVIGKPEGAIYIDDSGRTKKILANGDVVEVQSTTKDTRVKEKK